MDVSFVVYSIPLLNMKFKKNGEYHIAKSKNTKVILEKEVETGLKPN